MPGSHSSALLCLLGLLSPDFGFQLGCSDPVSLRRLSSCYQQIPSLVTHALLPDHIPFSACPHPPQLSHLAS